MGIQSDTQDLFQTFRIPFSHRQHRVFPSGEGGSVSPPRLQLDIDQEVNIDDEPLMDTVKVNRQVLFKMTQIFIA